MRHAPWAIASDDYRKRHHLTLPGGVPSGAGDRDQATEHGAPETLGFTWRGGINFKRIGRSPISRSRLRFRAQLPEFVWNAPAFEGNTFTLPEVRTLLGGVTIGGKRVEEAQQILALRDAHHRLDELLRQDQFSLAKETSNELHGLIAAEEGIESGHFRGEGSLKGGGHVVASTGQRVTGFDHGEGGQALIQAHTGVVESLVREIPDARVQALLYFAAATRLQFYFDGNTRIAHLMMAGHLIANGYEAVPGPHARRLEHILGLDALFLRKDATDLLEFLADCVSP